MPEFPGQPKIRPVKDKMCQNAGKLMSYESGNVTSAVLERGGSM